MRAALFSLGLALVSGAAVAPQPTAPPLPIVLSGQSNAVYLQPYFTARYPQTVTVAQDGMPIAAWDDGQPLWTALATALRRPARALVWWQGESNTTAVGTRYGNPTDYAVTLPAFMARVRAIAPTLPIVIVEVLPTPGFENVRATEPVRRQ